MDDSTFRASFTMTAASIQTFLQNEGSGLATFSDTEVCGTATSGAMMSVYSSYYSCGATVSAAQIIYDTSQAYGINPQVLLATMQKEQSLVTTPNPTASQLNYAMGYGCPDSSGCASYPGFFTQLAWSAWQFRYNFEAISGNSYGGFPATSYPCNGTTRYYSAALKTGNNITFYDDYGTGYANFTLPNAATSSLYCYTPHVFPGSAQEYYSGSYNFVFYFSLWFGGSATPYAFKSSTGAGVYLFVNGYKVAVPTMAMLQDYGINPGAIQTFTQTEVDNIPTPSVNTNGISPALSYLVQAVNNPAIFLVTVGQKYAITDMNQFYGFNFNTSNIAYLPLSFIALIKGSGALTDYIQNPHNSVFQINAGYKRIIFDYSTYAALNPSGAYTPVSDSISVMIPSGLPIVNREVLINNSAGTVFLLLNGSYYGLSSMDEYNCWGFGSSLKTPMYSLVYDTDVAPINSTVNLTSCMVTNNQGTTYLLNGSNKYSIPSNYGTFSGTINLNSDLSGLINNVPSASSPLSQAINSPNSPVVWYLENGTRETIPSLSTLTQLGISQITGLGNYVLSSIPTGGIKLADGELVKSDNNGAVYMVSGNSRILFASGSDFIAYHFNWSDIETIPQANLDQNYPYNNVVVQKYIYDYSNNTEYIADQNGCYSLTTNQLSNYGQTQTGIINAQVYSGRLYRNLNLAQCSPASNYVADPSTGTIYSLNNGIKDPFSSWNALVIASGTTSPYITNLSPSTLATFPTGPSI